MNLKYVVEEKDSGKKIKYILKQQLGLSERLIKKLKYDYKVLCNSIPVHVNTLANSGDIVEVTIDFIEDCSDIVPEKIHMDIIYEDDSMIVLNKQSNIIVHPTFSHPNGTLANAVMHHLLEKGICRKIRPVSRLDRDTTGIIIFAKNQYVQEFLIRQMNNKTFTKEYIGVVWGHMAESKGTINLPIARKPDSIMLRHISVEGAPSITHFEVLEHLNGATLLKFTLETGRTHQIRVHCQAVGYPLIGETLYSDQTTDLIARQALHSHKVNFIHPFTKEPLELKAPLPADIENLLTQLR